MHKRTDFVLLFGGGIDSIAYAVLLREMYGIRPLLLHVDYGQKSSVYERLALFHFAAKWDYDFAVRITDAIKRMQPEGSNCMLFTGDVKDDAYVHARNMVLTQIGFEHGDNVLLGLFDPGYAPFPDADGQFVDDYNRVMGRTAKRLKLWAPYFEMNRRVGIGIAHVTEKEVITGAATCWIGSDPDGVTGDCGSCKHCLLKAELMRDVNTPSGVIVNYKDISYATGHTAMFSKTVPLRQQRFEEFLVEHGHIMKAETAHA